MKNKKEYFKEYYLKNKERIMAKRAEKKFVCKTCRKTFGEKRRKQQFCSSKCLGLFYKGLGTSNKYYVSYVPSHPKANSCGHVKEHRYVVEKHIGRLLNDNEVVHHINGNKKDNRIDNLQILSKKEHSLLHMKERWSDFHSPEARKKQWKTRRLSKQSSKLIQGNKRI